MEIVVAWKEIGGVGGERENNRGKKGGRVEIAWTTEEDQWKPCLP